jgi:hypothetical protein
VKWWWLLGLGLGLAVLAVVAVNGRDQALSGGIERASMDSQWDEAMLAGWFGDSVDGTRRAVAATDKADLPPIDMRRIGKDRIVVRDLRGARWLGLIRGAGWDLQGGRLQAVSVDRGALELYGRRTTRFRGALLGLDTYASLGATSYKFFLLYRREPGARAVIGQAWDIPAADVVWEVSNGWWHDDVKALLTYDPVEMTVTVRVTGLESPFERKVATAGIVPPYERPSTEGRSSPRSM